MIKVFTWWYGRLAGGLATTKGYTMGETRTIEDKRRWRRRRTRGRRRRTRRTRGTRRRGKGTRRRKRKPVIAAISREGEGERERERVKWNQQVGRRLVRYPATKNHKRKPRSRCVYGVYDMLSLSYIMILTIVFESRSEHHSLIANSKAQNPSTVFFTISIIVSIAVMVIVAIVPVVVAANLKWWKNNSKKNPKNIPCIPYLIENSKSMPKNPEHPGKMLPACKMTANTTAVTSSIPPYFNVHSR